MFPGAPEPFVDLSTGINPHAYPVSHFPDEMLTRLPEAGAVRALTEIAARAYAAPSAAHVAAAPGTQILLPIVARLVSPRSAAVLTPTYGEFVPAATRAGHTVREVQDLSEVGDAELVFVANPNNPDGRILPKNDLLTLAGRLRANGGLLIVDEAFMDVGPPGASLAGEVGRGSVVVLRSFGKFFGLAGLRLGFAVTAREIAAQISAGLGPWAVSGPAIAAGRQALADAAWQRTARERLAAAVTRLDALLSAGGVEIIGGTTLFRLVRSPAANELFHHLGRSGIFVRRFDEHATWLRLGLPADKPQWERLQNAMVAFRRSG